MEPISVFRQKTKSYILKCIPNHQDRGNVQKTQRNIEAIARSGFQRARTHQIFLLSSRHIQTKCCGIRCNLTRKSPSKWFWRKAHTFYSASGFKSMFTHTNIMFSLVSGTFCVENSNMGRIWLYMERISVCRQKTKSYMPKCIQNHKVRRECPENTNTRTGCSKIWDRDSHKHQIFLLSSRRIRTKCCGIWVKFNQKYDRQMSLGRKAQSFCSGSGANVMFTSTKNIVFSRFS